MKIKDIMSVIESLSHSQGFYTRLYESLMEIKDTKPDTWVKVVEELEAQNFNNVVDVVLYFEA